MDIGISEANVMADVPLVSIIVVTYNSSKYVIETLESAKTQTYTKVELIVSDDGSKDDTVKICETWLEENKDVFVNTRLLTVEKNTGIPANCNRGLRAANGEWIKYIAGDDILLPNGVSDLLEFAQKNQYKQVISDMKRLEGDETRHYESFEKQRREFFRLDVEGKYKYYLKNPFFLNAPSLLFHKPTIEKIQPFDEQFILLEDQPYFLNMLRSRIDIGFLTHETVIYRIHSASIMGKSSRALIKTLLECYFKYRKPYLANDLKGKFIKWQIEKDYHLRFRHNMDSFFILSFRRGCSVIYRILSLVSP